MLDFHGLFPSYMALFPGGVYMEIESLRLDLHLKRKQKKPQGQHQRVHQRRKKKKKKKKPETVAQRLGSRCDLGSPRSELGCGGTWVAVRPGFGATAAYVVGLDLARLGSA